MANVPVFTLLVLAGTSATNVAWQTEMSVTERLLEKKFANLLKQVSNYPTKTFCVFGDTKLHVGHESKHRHPAARKLRMLARLKATR